MIRYKTFPPGWGGLRVPTVSRRAALAALSMYPACRPAALWAQRLAWTGVRLLGPLALPGRSEPWNPPMSDETWRALEDAWRGEVGSWEAVAVVHRTQLDRSGFGVLLVSGTGPVAYVKLRRDGGGIAHEVHVLEALVAHRPRSFAFPEPIAWGDVDGWQWLATRAVPPRLHRLPVDPSLGPILTDVEASLGGLPRPPETPESWRPMHGDFTPWNLRRLPGDGASLTLFDWEDAGWGPFRADEVLYRAVDAAIRGRSPRPVSGADEAVRHWRAAYAPRAGAGRDGRLASEVLRALDRLGAGSR